MVTGEQDQPPPACWCCSSRPALGVVGFLDDFIKIRRAAQPRPQQDRPSSSASCSPPSIFGILALRFGNADGLTPGSDSLSFVRDIAVARRSGSVGFVLLAYLFIAGVLQRREPHRRPRRAGRRARRRWCSAPTCSSRFWQFRNDCAASAPRAATRCATRSTSRWSPPPRWAPASGFLWWNATPGPDLHGRHRARWRSAGCCRGWPSSPAPSCCSSSSAGCSSPRRCRWSIQVAFFRTTPAAGVPHGAVPPPLRAGGLDRDHRHRPLLAGRRMCRRASGSGCSTRDWLTASAGC